MTDVLSEIKSHAKEIYDSIIKKERPKIKIPIRSLSNVSYDDDEGYFKIKGKEKTRSLNANTVKSFAQTLHIFELMYDLVDSDDIATKREAYYVSKNWGDAKFNEQPESDRVLDDTEAIFGVNRSQLHIFPEQDGASIVGDLTVYDKNPATGKEEAVDCTKMGMGGWNVPNSVDTLRFEPGKIDFILAVETAGMYQRLAYHRWWKDYNCLLVSLKGVPSRATRRFLRRLNEEHDLPVLVFTDGDPYGWLNIYRTLKVGSGNAAHVNDYFSVPNAKFIGVTAGDIRDYNLPTHALKKVDIKRLKDGLKNDPFIQEHDDWIKELKDSLKLGKRAEQQALAKHGLNYVMEKYLPAKIKNESSWLS